MLIGESEPSFIEMLSDIEHRVEGLAFRFPSTTDPLEPSELLVSFNLYEFLLRLAVIASRAASECLCLFLECLLICSLFMDTFGGSHLNRL